jgi:hypothetical protein
VALTLNSATARIGRQLGDAERAADQAILKASELMATLVQTRSVADVAPHTGQKALIRLARAQQLFVDASSDIFRVHDEMSQIGREQSLLDEEGSTPRFGLLDSETSRQSA